MIFIYVNISHATANMHPECWKECKGTDKVTNWWKFGVTTETVVGQDFLYYCL